MDTDVREEGKKQGFLAKGAQLWLHSESDRVCDRTRVAGWTGEKTPSSRPPVALAMSLSHLRNSQD